MSELECCKICGAFLTCNHKGECCPECEHFDPEDLLCMAGHLKKKEQTAEVGILDEEEDSDTFLFEDDEEDEEEEEDDSNLPPERDELDDDWDEWD